MCYYLYLFQIKMRSIRGDCALVKDEYNVKYEEGQIEQLRL